VVICIRWGVVSRYQSDQSGNRENIGELGISRDPTHELGAGTIKEQAGNDLDDMVGSNVCKRLAKNWNIIASQFVNSL
jgi:hypothetical protein